MLSKTFKRFPVIRIKGYFLKYSRRVVEQRNIKSQENIKTEPDAREPRFCFYRIGIFLHFCSGFRAGQSCHAS